MFRYLVSCLFILAVIAACGYYFFADYWEHRFDELIARQARVYRVDEKLVWSVIYEETYFRSGALGDAEEVGLMQITPLVARDWAKDTGLSEMERQANENVIAFLSDPERNIQVGCWYLEKLRERYRGRPADTAMMLNSETPMIPATTCSPVVMVRTRLRGPVAVSIPLGMESASITCAPLDA